MVSQQGLFIRVYAGPISNDDLTFIGLGWIPALVPGFISKFFQVRAFSRSWFYS